MFSSLFGPPELEHENEQEGSGARPSTEEAAPLGSKAFNLWNVATAVTNSVKARADELVKSVVDTDWKSELSAFSKEVSDDTKTLQHKTAELVEHIPERFEHLPEQAERVLPTFSNLPAQMHLPKDVGHTLEGVGGSLATFGKSLLVGTKELIEQVKDAVEGEIASATREQKRNTRAAKTAGSGKLGAVQRKYNRFEAEVSAMQRDSGTYCDEPEDAEDYSKWRATFDIATVKGDVDKILADNAFMAELESRIVPIIVEREDFWTRYFYRYHKLQQKENQRQLVAQRAKSLQQVEDDLGWDESDVGTPSATEEQKDTAEQNAEAPAAPSPEQQGAQPADGTLKASKRKQRLAQAAAAAAPAAAAVAAVAQTADPSSPYAPASASISPAADPSPVESPTVHSSGKRSLGGSSTSGPEHVEAVESDAGVHAETASEGSSKNGEWMVITTDADHTAQPAAHLPAVDEAAAASPAKEAPTGPVSAPAEATTPSKTAKPEPSKAAGKATNSAKAVDPKADDDLDLGSGPADDDDGEEVDEDWGNWD